MPPLPPKVPVPPISGAQAPRTIEDLVPPSYLSWKKTQSPEDMSNILKEIKPLLQSEMSRFRGVLPEPALQAQAKKRSIEAIKGYDPTKDVKLTTHIVNSLQKLYRENYKYQQAVRLSEELQRGTGNYAKSKEDLAFRLQREPTAAEVADDLGWPISKVERIERQARGEIFGQDLEYDPTDIELNESDPRIDYVYFDLDPTDQMIMEYSTGYGGKAILPKKDIADKLGISAAAVTQRSKKIADKLMQVLNVRTATRGRKTR